MKFSTSFDFGDKLVAPPDVKVKVSIESTLEELMLVPDMRRAIADGIIPYFKRLGMSDRSVLTETNRILYSGVLYEKLPYPYYLSYGGHVIRNKKDKTAQYTIQDFLEGKVPGVSAEILNLF